MLSIICLVLGNVLRRRLLEKYAIVNYIIKLVLSLRYLILFLILFVMFLFILKFLPNRKATFRSQVPAALLVSFFWILMSEGISIYVNFFDGFSMYGSMTTMMLILMYIYFGMYILLLCAEIDSMYEGSIRMWWGRFKKRK